MAVHSRLTRLIVNTRPLASHARTVAANVTRELADATPLEADGRRWVPGHLTGTWRIDGMVDADVFGDLAALVQVDDAALVSTAPEGYGAGNEVIFTQARKSQLDHSAPHNNVVSFTAGFQIHDVPLLNGVSLHDLEAETGASSESSVDGGASSSAGGWGILHCTAFAGTDLTVTIQDSANNSDWADLVTFTQLTAAGQELKAVSGTVNRYLRATWSGTFTSATFAVAFARS